jgi:tetratricopeptide (TPR) repeat protein
MHTKKRKAPSKPAGRPAKQPGLPAGPIPVVSRDRFLWLLLPVLLLATLIAYHPAWHGGMLWDDKAHITIPELRSAKGLWRIWFDLDATQQYYPVVHSAFWILYALWGDQTLAYHIVNILLHALSAFLLALILRRLSVPGAWLAAVIFALHPVHVESVAWISELKNTLSGALFLGAALSYLEFDKGRQKWSYGLAAALFVLALLSKSVTATLPALLLVVFWYQRGTLGWRRDIIPLLPFFAAGAGGGLFTVWVERTVIGAEGAEFSLNLIERCLIAGRAIWFYLGKLCWPVDLTFQYPRWQIDQGVWWQYLYLLGVVALFAGLWQVRKRSRAPLAAMLFFCGALFPAIGFFNVFPFRFSFVADHFQYLASIGGITLFSAGAASLIKRWNVRPALFAVTVIVGGLLAFLTWNQSFMYADAETLYRGTIARNPSSWMAHNNLGSLKLGGSRTEVEEGMAHIKEALKLKPDYAGARMNLGTALRTLGRYEEAIVEYQETLRLNPSIPEAHTNLGIALRSIGRLNEAIFQFREALKLKPDLPESHLLLGEALQDSGRAEESVEHIREVLRIQPEYPQAYNSLGNAFQRMGRLEDAIAQYQQALRIKPDYAQAHTNLGLALQASGRLQDAVAQHTEALRLEPDFSVAHFNLGKALLATGRVDEAVARFREAIAHDPSFMEAYGALGTALLRLGRPEEALQQYEANLRRNPESAEAFDQVGLALQEMGRLTEAMKYFREALRLNPEYGAAHYDLGILAHKMGRLDEAIVHYREAIQRLPGMAEIRNYLGIALAATGRLDEAAVQFKEALKLRPDYAEARANLAKATR